MEREQGVHASQQELNAGLSVSSTGYLCVHLAAEWRDQSIPSCRNQFHRSDGHIVADIHTFDEV